MWNFVSPRIVFGEGALDVLDELHGKLALIVTDTNMVRIGSVDKVKAHLAKAGIDVHVFDQVEPDPSVETRYGFSMNDQTLNRPPSDPSESSGFGGRLV